MPYVDSVCRVRARSRHPYRVAIAVCVRYVRSPCAVSAIARVVLPVCRLSSPPRNASRPCICPRAGRFLDVFSPLRVCCVSVTRANAVAVVIIVMTTIQQGSLLDVLKKKMRQTKEEMERYKEECEDFHKKLQMEVMRREEVRSHVFGIRAPGVGWGATTHGVVNRSPLLPFPHTVYLLSRATHCREIPPTMLFKSGEVRSDMSAPGRGSRCQSRRFQLPNCRRQEHKP